MNRKLKILIYGFLIWLIPFGVSVLIFPLRESMRPLFESIMPVVLSVVTIIFSYNYIKNLGADYLKEGVMIAVTWFMISLLLDLFLFIPESPMQIEFFDYMMDIGLTYLIIPVITWGMAKLALEINKK